MTTNNKLSIISPEQVPFFIRNENPNLELFLKKYYEFLEQNDQVLYHISNFRENIDIDNTTNETMENLIYDKFMENFPDTVASKQIIMKNIKDFYRAKGTEKAVRFLVNILGGVSNTEVYLPKRDILKASSGKWFKQKTIRIADITIDGEANNSLAALQKFTSRLITGNTTNSSAIVESVNVVYDRGAAVYELYLSAIYNNFSSREFINANYYEEGEEHTLSGRIFGGTLRSIYIHNPGSGYSVGDYINFETQANNSGSGANAVITEVSTGNVRAVQVVYGGSGFRINDPVLFVGTGVGANARVDTVATNELYHPNTYNFGISNVGNVINAIVANANTTIANMLSYMTISGLGPATSIAVSDAGSGYTAPPLANISGNTIVKLAGVLGRMNVRNAGTGYAVGEKLNFIHRPGSFAGEGANGIISSVDANGAITGVQFTEQPGWYIGGLGYSQTALPYVTISTANGTGGNVEVTSVLGFGDRLGAVNSAVGQITSIDILDRGFAYNSAPIINMRTLGNRNANLEAIIIAGVYEYPGRHIDDSGFLSSSNYLRGREYYQNYSYDVRSYVPMEKYKDVLLKVAHPAGLKLFGTYINEDNVDRNSNTYNASANVSVFDNPINIIGSKAKVYWDSSREETITKNTESNTISTWVDIISGINFNSYGTTPKYGLFEEEIPYISLNGVDDYLKANSALDSMPRGNTNVEIWITTDAIGRSKNSSTEYLFTYGNTATNGEHTGIVFYHTHPYGNLFIGLANTNISHGNANSTGFKTIRFATNTNGSLISVDNADAVFSNTSRFVNGFDAASEIVLGGRVGDGLGPFLGNVHEILITTDLTDDESNRLWDYFTTKRYK